MTSAFSRVYTAYKYISDDIADPNGKNFPIFSSPLVLLGLIFSYIYFCSSLGPRLMKDREPFQLKCVMIFYNAFQIFSSACCFLFGVAYAWPGKYKFFCEPLEESGDMLNPFILRPLWVYHILKIVDLVETVFFVLRKKTNQVSFLHLYHHAGMIFGTHLAAKYFPGGHLAMMGEVNALVHVVMYTYYLLTSITSDKRYVWWKKHMTQLQIAQFLFLTFHTLPTLAWKDCDYPLPLRLAASVQYFFMLCLFGKFYIDAYGRRKED